MYLSEIISKCSTLRLFSQLCTVAIWIFNLTLKSKKDKQKNRDMKRPQYEEKKNITREEGNVSNNSRNRSAKTYKQIDFLCNRRRRHS